MSSAQTGTITLLILSLCLSIDKTEAYQLWKLKKKKRIYQSFTLFHRTRKDKNARTQFISSQYDTGIIIQFQISGAIIQFQTSMYMQLMCIQNFLMMGKIHMVIYRCIDLLESYNDRLY